MEFFLRVVAAVGFIFTGWCILTCMMWMGRYRVYLAQNRERLRHLYEEAGGTWWKALLGRLRIEDVEYKRLWGEIKKWRLRALVGVVVTFLAAAGAVLTAAGTGAN